MYPLLHWLCCLCYNPNGIKISDNRWDNKMERKPPPSAWSSLALVGQLGFTIAIPIVLLAVGGNLLDGYAHTGHIFVLLGLLLGLAAGIYGAYRLFTRTQ